MEEKSTKGKFSILRRALEDKDSEIYLSKNANHVTKYLNSKGIPIRKSEVKNYMLVQKSASQLAKNTSRRKIRETSKSFSLKHEFFYSLFSDIIVLSRKRQYNTNDYLIITLGDCLSNFVMIENIASTKAKHVIPAFDRMINRCPYLPKKSILFIDNGVEYRSNAFLQYAKEHGMKMNFIKYRPEVGSRGSPQAEVMNRKLRLSIESSLMESSEKKNLKSVLKTIENTANAMPQSILNGISANEALLHDAKYISLLKASNRFTKRKFLRKELNNNQQLAKYCIVKIKKNNDKDIFTKESYGSLSTGMFIILKVDIQNFVPYYTLGSLFSLKEIPDISYSGAELQLIDVSYAMACYLECFNFGSLLRAVDNNLIEYTTANDDTIIVGPKELAK